nr:polyprotein [Sapelovirus sp.]
MAVLTPIFTKPSIVRYISKKTEKGWKIVELVLVYENVSGGFILMSKPVGYTALHLHHHIKRMIRTDQHLPRQKGIAASRQATGNKHQIAQAGGNVFQFNYYGSDYAQAKTDPTTNMDPAAFTKPVVDLLNGPALKSPTVEECGYSDRIVQLTSGNSTITTQEAANAVVAYGIWPEYNEGCGEAIDKLTEPGPAVDRFYTLDSVQWTQNWYGLRLQLPGALTDLGMFGQNCYYHYLMRSGFCVHTQINASKFHQGMLMVVAIPECEEETAPPSDFREFGTSEDLNVFYRRYPLNQLTLFPHQFINLRTNNSSTIILPYINAFPAENANTHNYWTVAILPVVPLQYASGASTVVPITISVAPMASSFSGLRQSVPVRQGVPVFEIPGSGMFMTTLRNSGFPTLPDFQSTHGMTIPGRVTNLMEIAQVDTICNANANGSATNPAFLLRVTNGQPTATQGPIMSWDMSLSSGLLAPTALARICKWFAFYRGSIQLTFVFCGSAMATGKFLIAYTPPGGDPPATRTQAMLATHVIWDVGLQSSCTMVIPWISQTQYRYANISGNTMSYAGYITMFYQTCVVVPPGAIPTCEIVVFASACKDFQVRLPTDNAYFQGLGDELGKIIQEYTKTEVQNALSMPATGETPSVPDSLSVQTGEAAALTAIETGATATTDAGAVMETRHVGTTFSALESDVENFFSKYALFYQGEITAGAADTTTGQQFLSVPMRFADENTALAVRAKYRMFTYLRMTFDVVIVVQSKLNYERQAGTGVQTMPSASEMKFQAMYAPPGAPIPNTVDGQEWFVPTTPSVYFSYKDPPVSFRLPFVSPAHAYASFFNGYTNFNRNTYGIFPGNDIGTLLMRPLYNTWWSDTTDSRNLTFKVMMFARPVGVQVWGPRPIVSLRDVVTLGPSRGRIEVVDDSQEGDQLVIGGGEGGTDIRMAQLKGPKRRKKDPIIGSVPNRNLSKCPDWALRFAEKFIILSPSKESSGRDHFPALPYRNQYLIFPNHLHTPDLHWVRPDGKVVPLFYTPVQNDEIYDLCVIEIRCPPTGFIAGHVPLALKCDCTEVYSVDLAKEFSSFLKCNEIKETPVVPVMTPFGPKIRDECLTFSGWVPYGWCGSPMLCEHGVRGQVHAGTDNLKGAKVHGYNLRKVPWIQRMEHFHRPGKVEEILRGVRELSFEKGPVEWFNKTFENAGASFAAGMSATTVDQIEQNQSWLEDTVKEMGNAFGGSAAEAVRSEIGKLRDQLADIDMRTSYVKKIIAALVKIVGGLVLITRSEPERRAETSAIVIAMLGIDVAVNTPFDWIKEQICKLLGVARPPEGQGLSQWIKEFNAACTAAKGLEWIGDKIMQFVEWIKKLVAREAPMRKKFIQQLETLPDLMASIDQIMEGRGKFKDEDVKRVCKAMIQLKHGADCFGVERNQATAQIIKYHTKAQALLQSISKGRFEPIAVLFHGAPGQGKSLATEVMGRCISEKLGATRPYSLPPDPKHFDGYAQQPVVVMDDVGQNPDGEDLKLFCQMVSTTEFIVPMAALEEKGMAFTSQFVLASTNHNVLTPPTISEPKALERRFAFDLDIELKPDFVVNGKLNASAALDQCDQKCCKNFRRCCPLICGRALVFKDRRNQLRYSLDELVTKVMEEYRRRMSCGSKIDAIFQGTNQDAWFAEPTITNVRIVPVDEMGLRGPSPCPKEIVDLLRSVRTPEVLAYVEEKGWVVPVKVVKDQIQRDTTAATSNLMNVITVLTTLSSVATLVWLMFKIFASRQGAYSGIASKMPLRRPEVRKAQVQGPDTQFASKLMNTSLFDVGTDQGHFTGLGLFDKWILLPSHSCPGEYIYLEGQRTKVLDAVDLHSAQGPLELTALKVERPVCFRDIRKFIPDAFCQEKDCTLVINNQNFPRMIVPVGTVSSFGLLNLSFRAVYNTVSYRYPTKAGFCGGIVTKAGKIIALHIGGDGVNGYGAALKRSYFAVLEGEIVSVEKVDKSVNLSTKTKLHPSVFHEVFPGTKEPAALHPRDPRLEADLEEAMFSKYAPNKEVEMTPEMEIAVEQYAAQLQPLLPPDLTTELELEEVVYGTENLEGLDLHTSAGYPYVLMGKRKKDYIPEKGEPLTKLTDALTDYGYDLPFVTYLKDELRPIEKIKAGKTRMIECSSMNDTIRMKRVFGKLFQAFHKNPGTVTGSAVGCNPDLHWSQFFHEMQQRPLVAFDYSNYDGSLHPVWFEALKNVLRKIGYDDKALKLIDYIKNSTHIYKDVKFCVEGGMPSGCSGTSIFNSMINNIIIRTLVLTCYKGIDLSELRIIAYGDDVVATYPFQLDAAILAEEGKRFGLKMTPPDKNSDFNETTWQSVTFLKRRFVPDNQFPFLIHPVYPYSEICESIRWCRSAASTQEHITSLCYLCWHLGEETYNEFVGKIREVPVGRALLIPPFKALRQQWIDLF